MAKILIAYGTTEGQTAKIAHHIADAARRRKPDSTDSFAGALKYTQYSWLKRALMKHISQKECGDIDTSRDFEYTDWSQVTRFAEHFCARLPASKR